MPSLLDLEVVLHLQPFQAYLERLVYAIAAWEEALAQRAELVEVLVLALVEVNPIRSLSQSTGRKS